ncbi:MAG: hypothetical protein QOG87_3074 [Actinomycetota bacterium]|jgi:hypothetical protein
MPVLAGLSTESVSGSIDHLGTMPEWLRAAADGHHAAAALAAAVPELAAGTWRLERCEPKLRLKDGGAWTAMFRLVLTDPSGQERVVRLTGEFRPASADPSRPAAVQGELGAAGWTAELPSLGLTLATPSGADDAELPALAALTDPQLAARLLGERLGIRIASCAPEVMRYKPGSRCTVRYQLGYSPGDSGPASVIAKTYRGDKGANAFHGMAALDRAGIPPDTVALAPALAYDPDTRVLVQGAVDEEQTLKVLAQAAGGTGDPDMFARLADDAAKAAAGLAAVHGSGVLHGDLVTWEDQWREVAELTERLDQPLPGTGAAVMPFLDRLVTVAADHPADRPGPAHRSFRPAQVLLARGRIAFIDFDGLCTAEPAMDVALFRAALRDAVMRAVRPSDRRVPVLGRRLAAVDEVCDSFLARYRTLAAVSVDRVALWESLYLLTSVLHCWTKVQPDRLLPRMAMLDHHLGR